MVRVSKLISNALLTSPSLEPLMTILMEEKENDYYNSLKKSIGEVWQKWEDMGPMWRAPFSLHYLSFTLVLLKMPKTSFNFLIPMPPSSPTISHVCKWCFHFNLHPQTWGKGLFKMRFLMCQVWGSLVLCILTAPR